MDKKIQLHFLTKSEELGGGGREGGGEGVENRGGGKGVEERGGRRGGGWVRGGSLIRTLSS